MRRSKNKEESTLSLRKERSTKSCTYLEDGPDWKGSDLCFKSSLITKRLSVASGLRLGLTPAEVQKQYWVNRAWPQATGSSTTLAFRRKSSAADLEKVKQAYPRLSEEETSEELWVLLAERLYRGEIHERQSLTYLAVSSRLEVCNCTLNAPAPGCSTIEAMRQPHPKSEALCSSPSAPAARKITPLF